MEALFLRLLNMSITASYLVAAVLVLRLALRKAPKSLRCALWALVALRLLLPVSIQSAASLIPSAETVPQEIVYAPVPAIQSGIGAVNSAVNPVLRESFTPEIGSSVNPLQVLTAVASRVWLAGVLALALYALVSCLRLRLRLRTAVRLEGNVWQSEAVGSPFVFGLVRPRIYLPFSLEDGERASVLAHERAHIARRDHWWKPLGYLLLTVYWFNPLLWLAYVLLCRDIELACDEKVIRDMDVEQRKAYSAALLKCSSGHGYLAACPLAFGEVGVKARIKSVLRYKKPAFWLIVAGAVALVALAVCFLTDPKTVDFGLDANPITDALAFDMRAVGDPQSYALNEAEIGELTGRLNSLTGLKKGDPYGGFTPFYSLSAILENGTRVFIRGYNTDGRMTDLLWDGVTYRVTDEDFEDYVSALCSLDGTAAVSSAGSEPITAPELPEGILATVDLTGDGAAEEIAFEPVMADGVWLQVWRLSVRAEAGNTLWSDELSNVHVGWKEYFLVDAGGRAALLCYSPYSSTGGSYYAYRLFDLQGGTERVLQEGDVEFGMVDGTGYSLDASALVSFADEVNALLGRGTLLVSTDQGELALGPASAAPYYETYSFLDELSELYAPTDDLATRLGIYRDYWNAVRSGADGVVPMLLANVRYFAGAETLYWDDLRIYKRANVLSGDPTADGAYSSYLHWEYPVGRYFWLEITEVGMHTDIVRGTIQLAYEPTGEYATFGVDDIDAFIDAHTVSADATLAEAVEEVMRSGWWDGGAHPAIAVDAGAFQALGMTGDGDRGLVTYYGFALYRGYDGDLSCVWEFGTWAAVTIGVQTLAVEDFWLPGDGANHDRDIAAKFPEALAEQILHDDDPTATYAYYRETLGALCDQRAAAKLADLA